MRREKLSQKSVVDTEKLRYLTLSSGKVPTLRIGDLQLNSYLSDDKDKYISLHTLLDITVSRARSSQNQGNAIPAKKPIKQILHKQIEKKDGYAASKNV